MPFPQAHIYVRDPFTGRAQMTFSPDRMKKVDFAFWLGDRLLAVEIDGSSHIGNHEHVTKDRMLARAGVQIVHILNDEIERYGKKIITELLPSELTQFWKNQPEQKSYYNPFTDEIWF